MKEVYILIKRYVPPYKYRLFRNVLFNILQAVFGSISFLMMTPVLGVLFGTSKNVTTLEPWAFTANAITHNFQYYMTQVKIEHGAASGLLYVGSFVLFATLCKVGFAYFASYEMIYIRNGVVTDIRNAIYKKVLSLPLPFFSDERKGDIMSRMTGDVSEVESSVMNSLDVFLKNPILIIIYLGTMIIISWQMTLFALLMLPIVGVLIGRVGKSLKKPSRAGQDKLGELLSLIDESLSGLRIIKSFNAEPQMEKVFDRENNTYRKIMNALMRRRELAHPMSEFLGTAVIIVVLWFGGRLILSGHSNLTGTSFIPYLALFYSIINPAKAFSTAFYSIQKGLASMDRIDMILGAQSSIVDKPNAKVIDEFKHLIEYRNVDFSYVEGRPVLKNISIEVAKGSTVALVGQSGSGKTTLVDLLPRFHDVKQGSILIDGVDIRDCTQHSLRALIGNVNQDPILFNDTVYNNIAFGMENSSMDAVIAAAKVANAHEFIEQMPQGYNTNIGDRGGKLSGGQRQRLSIARAILKNPPILILDEATSALDTHSEKMVQEALEKLMLNRTTLVIAHRLSTIRKANTICVFRDGEIIERGTHEELLLQKGAYTQLHEMQL